MQQQNESEKQSVGISGYFREKRNYNNYTVFQYLCYYNNVENIMLYLKNIIILEPKNKKD